LKSYISLVHSRMPSLPLRVLHELEVLENEIMNGAEDSYVSNKLAKLYLMFQVHIRRYSKALAHSPDKDPGVEVLVGLCNDAFSKLIESFDSKHLEQRAMQQDRQDHNHPTPILSYEHLMESLEMGLQKLSRIIDVAAPSEGRGTLSQKLFHTCQDVSHLSEDAAEYAGYLTITHVFSWISFYATQIQQEASRIFKGFQQYSASIITALPFWEFLPYDKHYEEHVNKAADYLLGRKLSLKCAHFLAAFRCLKDSSCLHALEVGYLIDSDIPCHETRHMQTSRCNNFSY